MPSENNFISQFAVEKSTDAERAAHNKSSMEVSQSLYREAEMIGLGVGGAMLVKFGVDELTGNRWSKFGAAVSDTWQSGNNMYENIEITKKSLTAMVRPL